MTNAELRAAVYQDLTRAHPAQRANVMALVSAQRIVALLDEVERLRAEDAAWEEREAACCPEDVGFEDMIRYLRADVARLRAAVEMAIDYAGNPSDTNECTISAPAFEEKWGLVGDLSDMRLVARWRSALASVKETTDE